MIKLSKKEYEEVKSWVYKNARPVEFAIWSYSFEGGSREAVLNILTTYQNSDGGFGNALEPDLWNPDSTPYTTLWAINILKMVGLSDKDNPIITGILKYLDSGVSCSDSGWLFTIPSNDHSPHAPWWNYNRDDNTQSIGLTAELSAFVLEYADKESPLYTRVFSYIKKLINDLEKTDDFGEGGIRGYIVLLDSIKKSNIESDFNIEVLRNSISNLIKSSIEYDYSKWSEYTVRPSRYIKSKNSEFYEENRDIVEAELEYIINKRTPKEVWAITWSWFDNYSLYPKEFHISENWWKAYIAIENISLLKKFDKIEF